MSSEVFGDLNPPYATIVADPPWHYDARVCGYDDLRAMPYSTMSAEEIAALPVLDIAAADAHLFLWTTNEYVWTAREIVLGWGFEPSQLLTWCKPTDRISPGGGLFYGTTEFVVYARRFHGGGQRLMSRAGSLVRYAREHAQMSRSDFHKAVRGGEPTGIVYRWENDDCLPNAHDWQRIVDLCPSLADINKPTVEPQKPRGERRVNTTWWEWPRGRHSEKPQAFLDIVEQVSPGPYVELFARAPRLGWDSWGWGYETSGETRPA